MFGRPIGPLVFTQLIPCEPVKRYAILQHCEADLQIPVHACTSADLALGLSSSMRAVNRLVWKNNGEAKA
jgi:hypothetical protein